MKRMKLVSRIAATLVIASLIAVPGFAARGSADFSHYVALGDSYGAGVVSSSLNERHQPFSYPAIIARQAGALDFVQPLVSAPGIGAEMELVDVVSFPPVFRVSPTQGQPLLLNFPRPYNNLSIPGANVANLTTLTGAQPVTGTASAFAQFILRGQGTAVQQAIVQQPTFITIWIGGNDLLGAVLAGTPAALTPVDAFRTAYNAMLDQLVAGAPNAGIVVGNLPTNPASLPILTTVPPFIIDPATRLPVLIGGQPINFIYQATPTTVAQLPAGSLVLLSAAAKLQSGIGIPPNLRTIPPFNLLPNVGTPLADSDVLTPTEIAAITARAAEFNTVITQAAQARDIPVADIKGLFDRFAAPGGFRVGPFTFNASYISGGIFSFDGFHLSDIGYMFFANEFIRTINREYETEIPVASLSQFLANNHLNASLSTSSGALVKENMEWLMSQEAADSILKFANPVKAQRSRAAGH
jgi:lysophospholipase L1-like esterase